MHGAGTKHDSKVYSTGVAHNTQARRSQSNRNTHYQSYVQHINKPNARTSWYRTLHMYNDLSPDHMLDGMRTLSMWHVCGFVCRCAISPPRCIPSLHLNDAILACCLRSVPLMMAISIDSRTIPLCLALALATPSLSANVASNTDTNAPSTLVAPRTPGPARSTCDRQMVPAE